MLLTAAFFAPLLARWSLTVRGDLRADGRRVLLRGRLGERSLGHALGVHVVSGEQGGSLILAMERGVLLAVEVDDANRAVGFGEALRSSGATRGVTLPRAKLARTMWALRIVRSLFALAYYLHVIREVIPGQKAFYGLGALGCGIVLLVAHRRACARPRRAPPPRAPRLSRALRAPRAVQFPHRLSRHARSWF